MGSGVEVEEVLRDAAALCGPLDVVEPPVGTVVYAPGMTCPGLPIVLSGRVDVSLTHASGHSMGLYRLRSSNPCLSSVSALLTDGRMRTTATVAEPSRIAVVPAGKFQELLGKSEIFRRFILANYARRTGDAIERLYSVAFLDVEQRLAEYLLANGPNIRMSHQSLADELGTAREVVSRALGRFSDAGAVRTGRQSVKVVSVEWLEHVVEPMGSHF